MYHKKLKNIRKSFTLIEVIVVMGVMGLIIGGLLVSLRQIIEGEVLLKKMQLVEEESRFILDVFANDGEYSDLDPAYKSEGKSDIFSYVIRFVLTEKKSEIIEGSNVSSEFSSYLASSPDENYYLRRTITNNRTEPAKITSVTLNNIPLATKPVFRVKTLESPNGTENFLITISLIFRVETKNQPIFIPIETSVVSRTFEI